MDWLRILCSATLHLRRKAAKLSYSFTTHNKLQGLVRVGDYIMSTVSSHHPFGKLSCPLYKREHKAVWLRGAGLVTTLTFLPKRSTLVARLCKRNDRFSFNPILAAIDMLLSNADWTVSTTKGKWICNASSRVLFAILHLAFIFQSILVREGMIKFAMSKKWVTLNAR